jgi:hypothetical protein
MSRWNYASDEQSIIAIEGLRMVTKADSYYAAKGGRDAFYLELEYRGLSKKVEYASKETRDKIFSDLVLLLTQRAPDLKRAAANADSESKPAVSSG